MLNTGINIDFDVLDYAIRIGQEDSAISHYSKKLVDAKKENWVGCFVNGKRIESSDKKQSTRENKNGNMFVCIGPDMQQHEYERIVVFKSKYPDKDYVVYTDNTLDEEGNLKIMASFYNPTIGLEQLIPIQNEEDWHFIEKILEVYVFGEDNNSKKRK